MAIDTKEEEEEKEEEKELMADKESKSKIMTKEEESILLSFLPKGKQSKVTLLYRGSRDGFGANDFHSKCNGKGATVTIVLSDGFNHVFGGFTNVTWNSANNWVRDERAFVYLLRSGKGDKPQKWNIKSGQEEHAISDLSNHGPAFGAGRDISIVKNCNSVKDNYCNPTSYSGPSNNAVMAGAFKFKVKEIEVYLVEC